MKFIGIAAAGGWGDVDSDNAMVLDLRHGKLSMPGAIGCIKDDFAGQGPGGGWASCHWDRAIQDYDCETNEGGFLLVSGKKIRSKTDPPLVERIRFAKGQSSAVVTGSIAAKEVKVYVIGVGKADQQLTIQLDSPSNAAKFHVVELGADPSGEMGIDDCDNGCTEWQGDLPDAAQYEIRVYTASPPAKYTLRISIR